LISWGRRRIGGNLLGKGEIEEAVRHILFRW
jgi:hypothetical protein